MRKLFTVLLLTTSVFAQSHIVKSETVTMPKGGHFYVHFAQPFPADGPLPHCTFKDNTTAKAWAVTRESFEILEREGMKVTYSCTTER